MNAETKVKLGVRCDGCGKFISFRDWLSGAASAGVTPLNEFGPERIEWTCARCNQETAQ